MCTQTVVLRSGELLSLHGEYGEPALPLEGQHIYSGRQTLSTELPGKEDPLVRPPRVVPIWMFPKIVVPPNHLSIINHPFWGIPIFGNIHILERLWKVGGIFLQLINMVHLQITP